MESENMGKRVERAKELSSKGENEWMEAEAELRKLTIEEGAKKTSKTHAAEIAKAREEAALALADLYAQRGSSDKLTRLLEDRRPLFAVVPKAKTAKTVMCAKSSLQVGSKTGCGEAIIQFSRTCTGTCILCGFIEWKSCP